MAITVTSAKTRVEQKLGALSDVTEARWIAMAQDLNEILYDEMLNADPDRFKTTQNYTVTTDSQTSALPADYQDAKQWGCGFFVIDSDGKEQERLIQTGFSSSNKGYYLDGSNVVFTGINASTIVKLRYVPMLTAISSMSSSFIVPDRFKELVTQGLIKIYYEEYEDPRQYDADAKFARLLGQLIDSIPRSPKVYNLSSRYSAY